MAGEPAAAFVGQGDILLSSKPHVFSLSWDLAEGSTRDIDLQGVAVDQKGTIVDAVYYNGPVILDGGAVRGWQETSGQAEVTITTMFDSLPEGVEIILFVVAAYGTGHLCDSQKVRFAIHEDEKASELFCHTANRDGDVEIVGAAFRRAGLSWSFRALHVATGDGRHFMDVLEELGKAIQLFIPQAPAQQNVQFALQRSAIVDLPLAFEKVAVGLGWDTTGGEVDLDVSGVLLDEFSQEITAVFFGNLEEPGLKHSGDNLTGAGHGDDEQIEMTFVEVDPDCQQVLLVINVFTEKRALDSVQNPYCRLLGNDGEEIARYQLTEAPCEEPALVIARFFRNPHSHGVDQRWGFQAMGVSATGNNYKDSLEDGVCSLAKITPQAFQQGRHIKSQSKLSCSADSFREMEHALSNGFERAPSGHDVADAKHMSVCQTVDEDSPEVKGEKVYAVAEVQTLPEQPVPASCCVVT